MLSAPVHAVSSERGLMDTDNCPLIWRGARLASRGCSVQDGSKATSLLASHTAVDGLGFRFAIADAVGSNTRDLGHPLPCSRTRLRAAAQGRPLKRIGST